MRTTPALDRGLEILQFIGAADRPVKPSELMEWLPRTATYELINTLRLREFIEVHEDGTLSLGVQLFTLGSKYAERIDPTHEAQASATQLTRTVDETVQVGVLRGRNVLYIARADPNRMVRLVSAVGRLIPAHCTAIGKALLSGLPDGEMDALYAERELEALTSNSITDYERLRAELTVIRRDGIAHDAGESNVEVMCVAAPVLDRVGNIVAALSISTTFARMTVERKQNLTHAVRDASARLAERLAGNGMNL